MSARRLIVEADGGSRGNPGDAGYGALIRDPDSGKILQEDHKYLGKVSNNVAEYSGLIAGLEMAKKIDAEASVLVRMDSKLVVEQMSGRWKIKHEAMRELAAKAKAILKPAKVTYEWIPREKNKDADRLSNVAMDEGQGKKPKTTPKPIPEEHAKHARPLEPGVPEDPRAAQSPSAQGGLGSAVPKPSSSSSSPPPSDATRSFAGQRLSQPTLPVRSRLNHIELWSGDLGADQPSWQWLLTSLGFQEKSTWAGGISWESNPADGPVYYVVLESGSDVQGTAHERLRPGLNHLAFTVPDRAAVDLLTSLAPQHGWSHLFAEHHPFAGGPDHYALYIENPSGFEVEVVSAQ